MSVATSARMLLPPILGILGLACQRGEEAGAPPGRPPVSPVAKLLGELPLSDCLPLVLEPLPAADASSNHIRAWAFTPPPDRELLEIRFSWPQAELARKLSLGQGACPPCKPLLEQKARGGARLLYRRDEVTLSPDGGAAWFTRVRVDPATDDLSREDLTIAGQACHLDAAAAAQGQGARRLPVEGLQPASMRVIEESAFGIEGLDRASIASYHREGAAYDVFVAERTSPAEALATLETLHRTLLASGGTERPWPGPGEGRAWLFGGRTTMVLRSGALLAGVVEAPPGPGVEALVADLHASLIDESPR